MIYRVGLFLACCVSLFGVEEVYLKAPDLSEEMLLGANVGIRPYRKSGMRVEAEVLQDKLVIHNYGYGGSGLTLSWGGSKEVQRLLAQEETSSNTVAILGGGVIGLTTAYDLLEQGYEVHIYADQWSPNLTSNVAAGIWSPLVLSESASQEQKELNSRILQASKERFSQSLGDEPEFAGIRLIASYSFKTPSTEIAIQTKHQGEEVLVHFDNGVIKYGRRFYEMGIDGKLFMEDLMSKVAAKGATFIECHFESQDDLLELEEPTLINCMSLGSRELFNDQEFVPTRGELLYFAPQEGLDFLLYQDAPNFSPDRRYFVSLYPWSDRLIVGGVYEWNEEELAVNLNVIDQILENMRSCFSGELDRVSE